MYIVEIIVEVIKYGLPSLIIYLLMRQFTSQQTYLLAQQQRIAEDKDVKALRFQAYERLIMFCERIKLSELVIRLNSGELDSQALKNILMVTVQKEYEHNITQQLYVSTQLWNMIELFKDQTLSAITSAYISKERADISDFVDELLTQNQRMSIQMGDKVTSAIKKEIQLFFDI